MEIKKLIEDSYAMRLAKGFASRPIGIDLMLINSELVEAFEEDRIGNNPTFTYYSTDKDGRQKPEGIPSEIADVIIRVADFCGAHGIDLEAAIEEKQKYNAGRPQKHGKLF